MRHWITGISGILAASVAHGQTLSPGTYMLEGGSYSINVTAGEGSIVVNEPNKTSTYARANDGSYHFTNPNNGVTYGLRIIDDHTIEAFKPDVEGSTPTRLVRMGGAPSNGPAPTSSEAERWSELASQYSGKIASDPANTQSWAACAAVAMKRSLSSEAEANAYAHQVAGTLKQMDAAASPCPDVIRSADW